MTHPSYLSKLEELWHSTAGLMSYYRADDSAKEWKHATALLPLLKELERQIKSYGGERPDGSKFLIGKTDRIDWETGK